jgi:hypothetical protein
MWIRSRCCRLARPLPRRHPHRARRHRPWLSWLHHRRCTPRHRRPRRLSRNRASLSPPSLRRSRSPMCLRHRSSLRPSSSPLRRRRRVTSQQQCRLAPGSREPSSLRQARHASRSSAPALRRRNSSVVRTLRNLLRPPTPGHSKRSTGSQARARPAQHTRCPPFARGTPRPATWSRGTRPHRVKSCRGANRSR